MCLGPPLERRRVPRRSAVRGGAGCCATNASHLRRHVVGALPCAGASPSNRVDERAGSALAQPHRALRPPSSNTGPMIRTSERLITLSTSPVAICCSSASVEVAVPRLQLLEQPHVLDRDDCLIGEGLEQRDLRVREAPHLAAAKEEHSDRHALAEEGRGQRSAVPELDGDRPPERELVLIGVGEILHVNRHGRPRRARPATHPRWIGFREAVTGRVS